MAKTDSQNLLDTYDNISIDDTFYFETDIGVTNSKLWNHQKSIVSGGYDSGVDCVSCKSSEGSTLNNEADASTLPGSVKYANPLLNNVSGVETANTKESYDKRSNIQPDPGPTPTSLQENNDKKAQNCQPSYGWVVVLSCFFLNVIQAGIAFCGGIVLNAIAKEFGETRSRVSLIGSFFNGFLLCSAPLVEHLIKIMGLRIVCVSGSFIAAAAFTASIFSPNLDIMIMTQGVIAGIGIGLVYLPSIIAPSFYFYEKRAVAYGIGICGQGI